MAKKKEGVVAFDFDGVICNSAKESYIQALEAYREMGGKIKHSERVLESFMKGRPLVTKLEQYYALFSMLERNPRINFENVSAKQFEKENQKHKQQHQQFTERFLHHRRTMAKMKPFEWAKLHKKYFKIDAFIKRVAKNHQVFITTTKDFASVKDLLRHFGIQNIPDSHIFSKDFSNKKTEQLKAVSKKTNVPLSQIVLVEDAVEQVRKARSIGAKAVLVPYGYSTKRQITRARKEGFPNLNPASTKKESKKLSRMIRRGRK